MNLANKVLLKNGTVLFEDGFRKVDILINHGTIYKIANKIDGDYRIIDCTNKLITPGFIDVHVHLREPGFTYKEDIASGSLSALRGGYTKIYAMPNTKPAMDNVESVNRFNNLVKQKAYCDVKTFAAITKNLKGEKLTDIEALGKLNIAGFSDDGKGIQDESMFERAIELISKTDKVLSVHSEDETELKDGYAIDSNIAEKFNCVGINNASEANMVKRDLKYIQKYNIAYHVCHVSTKETVELIKESQRQGYDTTGEVTAHHLILNNQDIKENDGNYKMNPPLRSKEDQNELIIALRNNEINIIASDHAPHSKEEKSKGLAKSMFGIIGLEQTYSVLNTFLIDTNIVGTEQILRAMTYNPAKKFNEDIEIKEGKRVNLTIVDPNKNRYIDESKLLSKSSNTLFINIDVKGDVTHTLLDDKIYDWR